MLRKDLIYKAVAGQRNLFSLSRKTSNLLKQWNFGSFRLF